MHVRAHQRPRGGPQGCQAARVAHLGARDAPPRVRVRVSELPRASRATHRDGAPAAPPTPVDEPTRPPRRPCTLRARAWVLCLEAGVRTTAGAPLAHGSEPSGHARDARSACLPRPKPPQPRPPRRGVGVPLLTTPTPWQPWRGRTAAVALVSKLGAALPRSRPPSAARSPPTRVRAGAHPHRQLGGNWTLKDVPPSLQATLASVLFF